MGQRAAMQQDIYSGYQTPAGMKYPIHPAGAPSQAMADMGMRRSPAQSASGSWSHQGAYGRTDVSCFSCPLS